MQGMGLTLKYFFDKKSHSNVSSPNCAFWTAVELLCFNFVILSIIGQYYEQDWFAHAAVSSLGLRATFPLWVAVHLYRKIFSQSKLWVHLQMNYPFEKGPLFESMVLRRTCTALLCHRWRALHCLQALWGHKSPLRPFPHLPLSNGAPWFSVSLRRQQDLNQPPSFLLFFLSLPPASLVLLILSSWFGPMIATPGHSESLT